MRNKNIILIAFFAGISLQSIAVYASTIVNGSIEDIKGKTALQKAQNELTKAQVKQAQMTKKLKELNVNFIPPVEMPVLKSPIVDAPKKAPIINGADFKKGVSLSLLSIRKIDKIRTATILYKRMRISASEGDAIDSHVIVKKIGRSQVTLAVDGGTQIIGLADLNGLSGTSTSPASDITSVSSDAGTLPSSL